MLDYDANTGIFTRRVAPKNLPRLLGKPAGCVASGYVMIKINGIAFKAHQLAWLWVYGIFPRFEIDHKDTDPLNNAIDNLRRCTNPQNQANRKVSSKRDLPKGVRRTRAKFTARIRVRGKLYHIGTYSTPREAAEAYYEKAKEYYGEFARMDMGKADEPHSD